MVYKRKYTKRSYARKSYYPSRRQYKPRNTISIPFNRKRTYRKDGIKACASLIKKKLKYTLSAQPPAGVINPMSQYVIPNKGKVALVVAGSMNGGIWDETNITGMAKHLLGKFGAQDFVAYDKTGVNPAVKAMIMAWKTAQEPSTLDILKQVFINSQLKKQKMDSS